MTVKKTCKTSEYLVSQPSLELSTFDHNWNNTVSNNWFPRLLLLFFVVVVTAVVGGGVVMMAASFVVVVVVVVALVFAAVVVNIVTDCEVCS
jgi:hypothetical protein